MDYMMVSEKEWGKAHGLKKTNMKTATYPCGRTVYRANDGRLYYRDHNAWKGTFEEDCYAPDALTKAEQEIVNIMKTAYVKAYGQARWDRLTDQEKHDVVMYLANVTNEALGRMAQRL